MTSHISTLEVRKSLGDILNRVSLRHDHFIIERKGKPLAALIPADRLERLESALRENLLDSLRAESPRLPQAQADQLAQDAKRWARGNKRPKKGRS